MDWTDELSINAWSDEGELTAQLAKQPLAWALGTPVPKMLKPLAPPARPDWTNWRDTDVGWGLLLPHKKNLSGKKLASAADAPKPIRDLLAAREGAVVLRYEPDSVTTITRYERDGSSRRIFLNGSNTGTSPGAVPFYILVYATPSEIPWEYQFILQASRAVGRLDLTGTPLRRYVTALLEDWNDASASANNPLVWATNHSATDITRLMRDTIADPLYKAFKGDNQIGSKARFQDGQNSGATGASLIKALGDTKPALVVTTSHGRTGPLANPDLMRQQLGVLVDQDGRNLSLDDLIKNWQPDGAIWYAHACCSAGCKAPSIYDGLLEADSSIDKLLKGVAALGQGTAPLPQLLLGAAKPLRAFIGHVEPTFNWTLRHPNSTQDQATPIRQALYNNLFNRDPVGLAFRPLYSRMTDLFVQYDTARAKFNEGQTQIDGQEIDKLMVYAQLAFRDIQSTVILGDPTVRLPALK
jgi:hypothetical protein